jgi:hypothetical protein|tara:strand:+ start:294 stop:1400 length:1107 start_codon:yes stop_codon:yes gene_type:complete
MERHVISRIFHPIGQGAFYAELHSGFNIVYDCGNWKKTTLSGNVVGQSFTADDVIDILFISHFDWDHISRIDTLRDTVKQIKCVIMPLLHDDEKIFITNIHRVLGFSSSTLVNKPHKFFGEDVRIIYVESSEKQETLDDDIREIDIISSSTIRSGTQISLGHSDYSWVFIPFNIENRSRSRLFENDIVSAGFDLDKLRNDPSYTINKIKTTSEKNKIKKIYNSIRGKINQNSMIVYSGCHESIDAITHWSHKDIHGYCYPYYRLEDEGSISCIYTGDVDLNVVNLELVFKKYWKYVGTVQIPHHGSVKDFNSTFMTRPRLFCPISYGKTNTYGHPSLNVISQIKSKGCIPLHVTEDLDAGAIQIIEFF